MLLFNIYQCEYVYRCKYCNQLFASRKDCLEHEAQIFGFSLEEYQQWLDLKRKAKDAYPSDIFNDDTRAKFDRAVEDVVEFEKQHNLKYATIKALKHKHACECT